MYKVSIEITENLVIMGIGFMIVCICGVSDMRKRTIPLAAVVLGGLLGLGIDVWQMSKGNISFGEVGLAVLPGCFFLLVSFLSREKVGYGDGLLLVVVGLFTGFYRCMVMVSIGLLLLSVTALVLLVLHKVHRNSKLPFVPFLAAGMGVGFFV